MRPFSLLVKPASADCNLDCEYCFYKKKANLYPAGGGSAGAAPETGGGSPGAGVGSIGPHDHGHRMGTKTLEAMIRNFFSAPQREFSFGWQGGEPTLMGLDFFKQAVELQRAYGPDGSVVSNGLQTNGVLIDDAFAAWLAENRFLVGISIDGPSEVHDRYRRTVGGGGSHHLVMKGLEALKRHGAEFNMLTLVTQANVHRPAETYHYLKDLGAAYHQYIPCVELDEAGHLTPYSITGEQWGAFLAGVFDEWASNDVEAVSVRLFDAVLQKMLTGSAGVCAMGKDCRHYFVVEHNGDIYPCDFYVEPELLLGDVYRDRFVELWRSGAYRSFGRMKKQWNQACSDCPYLTYCAGDCPKMRVGAGPVGAHATTRSSRAPRPYDSTAEAEVSVLCPGWKHFYAYTLARFEELATEFRAGRLRRSAV